MRPGADISEDLNDRLILMAGAWEVTKQSLLNLCLRIGLDQLEHAVFCDELYKPRGLDGIGAVRNEWRKKYGVRASRRQVGASR